MRARIVTGAHVVLYVNGKPYGMVTAFSFQSSTPRKAIYAVDSTEPVELAATTTRVTGSISLLRTIGDGGLEGRGIAAPLESISAEKYITITLIERSSDTVIFSTDRASVTGQSWEVGVKSFMTGQMQFEAINWNNEAASHS